MQSNISILTNENNIYRQTHAPIQLFALLSVFLYNVIHFQTIAAFFHIEGFPNDEIYSDTKRFLLELYIKQKTDYLLITAIAREISLQ